MEIITNNVPRFVTYGYELTKEEAEEFDYLKENLLDSWFVKYKGEIYDLGEFSSCRDPFGQLQCFKGWDGYLSDTFFSGILVRFVEDESVVMGRYFA